MILIFQLEIAYLFIVGRFYFMDVLLLHVINTKFTFNKIPTTENFLYIMCYYINKFT